MVYNPRDHEWFPNATDNPWAYCPVKNPEHEYHVIHIPAWSLQLTDFTLSFDVKSECIFYGKTRTKCDLERGNCPNNHAIKTTVIWKPNYHCRIFDVNRSHARSIKFQKPNFLKHYQITEQIKDINTTHTCVLVVFKNTFMMQSLVLKYSLNLFINVMSVCKNIFIQHQEGFNFVTGKPSHEFKGVPLTLPNKASSTTPCTSRYVIPQESPVYQKSKKYEFFCKQNWFGAVHPNAQFHAKLDYKISRVQLEMSHTSLCISKNPCNLGCDLKQTAFILLTQKLPLVGYINTGQQNTFATLTNSNLI